LVLGDDYPNAIQGETIGNLNIPTLLDYGAKTNGKLSLSEIEQMKNNLSLVARNYG
jgi:hypothetical protein